MTYGPVSGGVAAMVLGRAKHAFIFDERPRTWNVKRYRMIFGRERQLGRFVWLGCLAP